MRRRIFQSALPPILLAAILAGCAFASPKGSQETGINSTATNAEQRAEKSDTQAENARPAFLRKHRPETSYPLPTFNVWRPIGAIVLVLAGLFAVGAFLRKRRDTTLKGGPERRITFLERSVIDHRRSLMLVKVDGRRVLIGISPDRMESLAVLDEREDGADKAHEHEGDK